VITPDAATTIDLVDPIDLARTTLPLRLGPNDPSSAVVDGSVWLAVRTPLGGATVRIGYVGRTVEVVAWGEGADAAVDSSPNLIGATDDTSAFRTGTAEVEDLARRFAGVRLPRSGAVADALIAHLVWRTHTPFEAQRARLQLAERWGGRAPGPTTLLLPPDPQELAGATHYDLHLAGLNPPVADMVKRIAASARRLDALALLPPGDAHRRLREVAGVDEWVAAKVAIAALGAPDAVPLGDVDLNRLVTSVISGSPTDSDDAFQACLDPWKGQRARVIRLIESAQVPSPSG